MKAFIDAWRAFADLTNEPDTVGYDGAYGSEAMERWTLHLRQSAAEWLAKHPALTD